MTLKRILLDGGLIITMDAERRMIRDGCILMEGDTIAAVGKCGQIKSEHQWDELVDTSRHVILPGFVETHIHLSEHIARSLIPDDERQWLPEWLLPIYAALSPEDEYYATLLAGIEMVKTGTTTFCEAGTCFHMGHVADAVKALGIRGILGRWTWDIPPGPTEMQQTTDQALKANEQLLKVVEKLDTDLVKAWPLLLGMGTASDELLAGAKRLADEHGVGLGFMHASNIPSLETETRIQSLRHFEELGILDSNLKLTHMVYVEDDEIELLSKYGIKITHCPTAAMKHSKGICKYGKFPEMIGKGICVSLGVDSANSSDHSNMLRLIHLVAHIYKDFRMSQAVFPAETVLEMATIRGAEALLMEKHVGSIEKGKKADLVLFSTNHPEWHPLLNVANNLVYAVTDKSIDSVYVGGKLVLDQGTMVDIDECGIYEKIDVLSHKILGRCRIEPKLRWPLH
jgi:5-methylthioadenosine/S-adenosylhomocysteine deaminase